MQDDFKKEYTKCQGVFNIMPRIAIPNNKNSTFGAFKDNNINTFATTIKKKLNKDEEALDTSFFN